MLDRDGGVVRGARGPGFATRDLQKFFFFLFLLIYFGLFKVFTLHARLYRALFLSTAYTDSETDCFFY